ncbi:translesion error-prone DNA polymerase V subunit UmuC [Zophobihabitans entericus]|uniref:Translesion error-prone DNA polymerase V subunit UmuC n=1 Tax=Zophobihabitans entericus TaxID=1635327 RepID=A0A6G9ICP4_9GAMM|nr:translesion error-prone DNA polymerase V subunit UmuC [Zophobihabitans entericus]QIQ21474.1 translesion error-prone DNA polymerase V subunit UmuC [Zophobihabitans entericus]
MFALVDVNSFFASCETVFRPDILGLPVVVLSNNDGCVIARSKEAKEIGIKMAVPYYQIKHLIKPHKIQVFSSNYPLYGDLSHRVMSILEELAPKLEIYSIDEAFLDVSGIDDLFEFGKKTRSTILKCTGLTVGVGIGPTKTLAKLANYAAKKWTKTQGVVDLSTIERQKKLMGIVPVGEVWGIGRQLSSRLEAMGVKTALDLANSNPKQMRKLFSVVLERTIAELNGESCLSLEEFTPVKQQIVCSRSFSQRITKLADMRQAISSYAERAAKKLRDEKQRCKHISVFIKTSPFNGNKHYLNEIAHGSMQAHSSDSRDIIHLSVRLLDKIWQDGQAYQKAGVILGDFSNENMVQVGLFDEFEQRKNSDELMKVIDEINLKKGRVWFAGQGTKQDWKMKQDLLSPSYTTKWKDIPIVKVK